MLKLDPDTRFVPVLTCTTESDGQDSYGLPSQPAEDEASMLPARPAPRMH
jgi:hypothetical protein